MPKSALRALDRLEVLGQDTLIFISGDASARPFGAEGRSGGLEFAAAKAPAAAAGLEVAPAAPEGVPAEPELPDPVLPGAAPFGPGGPELIRQSDITVIDAVMVDRGGGGGKNGGNNGGTDSGTGLLSSYVSGDQSVADSLEFNVQINFKGTWTVELQAAFTKAADYLSAIIHDDLPDVFFRGKVVDDIKIDAELKDIDGEGGILGQAGPTAYRTASYLPATAIMQFDVADAAYYDGQNLFDDIVLHEMLHSIGFGTMWDLMGLLADVDGDLRFTGDMATAQYAAEFESIFDADANSGIGVPVETDGGPGTTGGHWDDVTFQSELMTGYIGVPGDSLVPNYLSTMTIAALEDMGYDTILDDPSDDSDWSNIAAMPADPIIG